MAIIKIIKRDCPYVTIDKAGIDDPNLSWAATGLLTYLIGRPSDWKINIMHLSGVKLDGERATRGALLELRETDYCHYFEIRKKGKVVETIYLVFEIPISYEEAIKNYIDLKDDELILYKEVKKKKPKVQNEVSVKNIGNKELLPKVRNAKTNNAKGENEGLLIIDTTNKKNTNNKTTTNEDKKSSSLSEKNSLEKSEINNILKNYNLTDRTKENILKLYFKNLIDKNRLVEVLNVAKIKEWGEGAIYKALKENWNIQQKNNPMITEDEVRNKIKEEQEKIEEEKRIRKNMEKQNRILEEFLALDEKIQKHITTQAESYYPGSESTLEIFKKASYTGYLKAIYKGLLKVIKENYPKILSEMLGEGV